MDMYQLQTRNADYMLRALRYMERFTGEDIGMLPQFIKLGDRFHSQISRRFEMGKLDQAEVEELQMYLVTRVASNVLTRIHCDCLTPWAEVRNLLKSYYCGGRLSVEEDTVALFACHRRTGQRDGDFAEQLWAKFDRLREKISESSNSLEEAAQKLQYLTPLLKVHLINEISDKNGVNPNWTFDQTAKGLWERDGLEYEKRSETHSREPESWVRVDRRSYRSGYKKATRREVRQSSPRRPTPRRDVRERGRPDFRRCFECKETGHLAAQCNRAKCFDCGKRGHFARNCPQRNRYPQYEPMEVNAARIRHEEARKQKIRRRRDAVREIHSYRPAGESDTETDESSGYSLYYSSDSGRKRNRKPTPWTEGSPTGADVVRGKSQ